MPDPSAIEEEFPVLATLHPAENMALTVARAQLARGENPPPNTTAMLVAALDRISGVSDWTLDG
jgi:hypothetical protein